MGPRHRRACIWVIGASAASIGWARLASALNINCDESPARLVYHYPNEGAGPVPRGAVFWAVGTPQTELYGAYLDDSTWLEPAGPLAPLNWLLVPPADLAPGPHTLEFAVKNVSDGSLGAGFGGLVHFELSETLPPPEADGVTLLELSAALRFPSASEEYALHRAQRDALLAEKQRLTELPGDCTAFVDDQFELCYWQYHRGDPTAWGNPGYEELGPDLWTAFSMAGNALGYGMGERFLPADCRGVLWDGDGFGGGMEVVPLYATGLGSPIRIDEGIIADFEPPPPPPPAWDTSTSACALASLGRRSERAVGYVLLAAAAVLVRRRMSCSARTGF